MRRWVAFNGVGLLGFAVQVAALALLVRLLQVHYVLATVIAVEAAILHNFIWHQRWTWRDRRCVGWRATLDRLRRFHLLNGAVSLAGNVGLVFLLTGVFGVDPVHASVTAVIIGSVINYVASEVLVFRTAALILALTLAVPAAVRGDAAGPVMESAAELQPQTLAGWERYARQVDERYERTASPLFAHDAFKRTSTWRDTAQRGVISMFEVDRPSPDVPPIDVPDGRIHHWVGAVFIPGATVRTVLNTLQQNAGHEARSYEDVLDSRLLARDGNRLRVFMKLRRATTFVTVTYNTEHDVVYRTLSDTRATSRSIAVKIAELADAGTPREREKKTGEDYGFLWRLNAYWRFEEMPGGVLIECESVSLSRGIPVIARWLISGAVKRVARESLERTLLGMRNVLSAAPPSPKDSAGKPISGHSLKRSSNALRALGAPVDVDVVSRSIVVRGSNSGQVFSASFGETRAGTGF